MKKTLIPLIVAATASYASAATSTVIGNPNPLTENVSFFTSNIGVIEFDSFDNSLGTLTSVEITITALQRADVTIENDAPDPLTANATLSGNVEITVDSNENGIADDSFDATANISLVSADQAFAASDGTAGSGPDFHDFGTLSSGTVSETESTTNAALLAFFSNSGGAVTDLDALVEATGGWNASGLSDSTLNISEFEVDATVVVTYTYEPVPEPSSALLGLAGVGLLAFRRKRS